MYFFVDPAIVTLPKLSEIDEDDFLDFIDSLIGWASLLNEHKFYISQRCKDALYDSTENIYPPTREIYEEYWKKFHVAGFYSLSDVYIACQKLMDIDTLTTIETLVDDLLDPQFILKKTEIKPENLCDRYHEGMKKALEHSYGSMAFLYHEKRTEHKVVFREMKIASYAPARMVLLIGEIMINVEIEAYVITSIDNTIKDEDVRYQVDFPIITKFEEIKKITDQQKRIASNKRIIILGGHSKLIRQLNDLKTQKNLEIDWVEVDDMSRVKEIKKKVGNFDGLIVVTGYVRHSISDIRDVAENRDIPVEYVNENNLSSFYEALAKLSEKFI